MNPYTNEEMAWQRLKDLEREMENSRLIAAGGQAWTLLQAFRKLAARIWWLGGLAMRRPPRRSLNPDAIPTHQDDRESKVA